MADSHGGMGCDALTGEFSWEMRRKQWALVGNAVKKQTCAWAVSAFVLSLTSTGIGSKVELDKSVKCT